MKTKKGMSAWIWILIIIALIVIGVVAYLMFTNPGAIISGPGSQVPTPQPPALPSG